MKKIRLIVEATFEALHLREPIFIAYTYSIKDIYFFESMERQVRKRLNYIPKKECTIESLIIKKGEFSDSGKKVYQSYLEFYEDYLLCKGVAEVPNRDPFCFHTQELYYKSLHRILWIFTKDIKEMPLLLNSHHSLISYIAKERVEYPDADQIDIFIPPRQEDLLKWI